jgi:D-alanyl-D-alanine carboxypeptidase (penicillin-binding protein 5/6)
MKAKVGMRFFCVLIALFLACPAIYAEDTKVLDLETVGAVLMDAGSGQVLYEENPHERVKIASVTKVMTMLLIMEAIKSGKITMDEMVTASEYACSMGGSQIYLEPGEQMTVEDMIKAIAVASANDASVAMAEHIMGSHDAFVQAMNKRAKALGMNNTNFINSSGLDGENQYSCALDVAIMSRELMKHETICPYLKIWTDSLRGGEFGLANTNKLIRFYQGATGIKTGSTDEAKYCLAASATRDNLSLIAVVLGSPTSQIRFNNASKLLDYGFANYAVVQGTKKGESFGNVDVSKGAQDNVEAVAQEDFQRLVTKDKKGALEVKPQLPNQVIAPVNKGDKIGELHIYIEDEKVGTVNLIAKDKVDRIKPWAMFMVMLKMWTMS